MRKGIMGLVVGAGLLYGQVGMAQAGTEYQTLYLAEAKSAVKTQYASHGTKSVKKVRHNTNVVHQKGCECGSKECEKRHRCREYKHCQSCGQHRHSYRQQHYNKKRVERRRMENYMTDTAPEHR